MSAINSPNDISIEHAKIEDMSAICDIYNQGITSRKATFDTNPRTPRELAPWVSKQSKYPVLVAKEGDSLIGFARLSEYSPRDCYQSIAEFSIYLADEATGKGLGTRLLTALLSEAQINGFSKLVSRIFTFNHASLSLCQKLGFRKVGIYERHGQLNGEWLDVIIVEKLL